MTTPAPREGLSVEPLSVEEERELRKLLGTEMSGNPGSVLDIERRLLATLDNARAVGRDLIATMSQSLPVEPDLRALSDAASPGEWRQGYRDGKYVYTGVDDFLTGPISPENAAYIVALVNAHRARLAAPVDPGEDVVERLPDGIIRNGDRALTPPHRDDDKLCGCDSCMEYWAEDEGVNWSRLIPQRRVALRVMDSGDDRLEPLRTAFVENIEGSAQGEIDARRVPGLLRVEGSIGSTLHVGTDYRVVEIREHHEPSGIEGEPPIVTTVIRFDPILAPVDRVGGEGPERE